MYWALAVLAACAILWDSLVSGGGGGKKPAAHNAPDAQRVVTATARPLTAEGRAGEAVVGTKDAPTTAAAPTSRLTALVMADTRSPWPPAPSTNPRLRLLWQPTFFQRAVAMASAYARRHCYDLRVYRFTSAKRQLGKYGVRIAASPLTPSFPPHANVWISAPDSSCPTTNHTAHLLRRLHARTRRWALALLAGASSLLSRTLPQRPRLHLALATSTTLSHGLTPTSSLCAAWRRHTLESCLQHAMSPHSPLAAGCLASRRSSHCIHILSSHLHLHPITLHLLPSRHACGSQHDPSMSIDALLHAYAPDYRHAAHHKPTASHHTGSSSHHVAWFPDNWPWTDSSPANPGFFILRNSPAGAHSAIRLLQYTLWSSALHLPTLSHPHTSPSTHSSGSS